MKYLPALVSASLLTSCAAMSEAFGLGPEEHGQAIGQAAGDAAGLITGNPAIDMGVTVLVTAAATWFLKSRKSKQPAA